MAITAVMLITLGFQPIKAAAIALVANTAPVAFGAIAIPFITLGEITGLPKHDLGAMVGRQTALLALFVPLVLVGVVNGMRGTRRAWPAAVVGLVGRQGELFRRVLGWSMILLLNMCVLVYLRSTAVLSWMVV